MYNLRYIGVPVERLKDGNHFFGFVPNNLGEMVYCDSNNFSATAEDDHKAKRGAQIGCLGMAVVAAALLYFLFINGTERSKDVWLGFMIIALACACGCLYMLLTPTVFKGIDYFVGKEGFAFVHFKGSRTTIVKTVTIHFKDIVSFSYKRVGPDKDGSNDTTYYFNLKIKDASGNIVEEKIRTTNGLPSSNDSYEAIQDPDSRAWKRIYEEWEAWQSRH